MRYFDQLLQALITRSWPVIRSRCWRKDLFVDGGGGAGILIPIHGGALLFDVNGLLDFVSVPLLLSA